jgi:hypothetical protein
MVCCTHPESCQSAVFALVDLAQHQLPTEARGQVNLAFLLAVRDGVCLLVREFASA